MQPLAHGQHVTPGRRLTPARAMDEMTALRSIGVSYLIIGRKDTLLNRKTKTFHRFFTIHYQATHLMSQKKNPRQSIDCQGLSVVPRAGLEPAHLAAHAPETCASTNSATWAFPK